MLKGRVMAVSSVALSLAAIGALYGLGAGFVHGEWQTFGITIGIFALAIIIQLGVAVWHDSH